MAVQRPGKVIEISASNITGIETWPYDDGSGDPWYAGNNPYRWRVVAAVPGEAHSSHLTREAFVWNGLDIVVGDWMAGQAEPKAVKIIEIDAKTIGSITMIVEDVDRYNTFNDNTSNGVGIFSTGSVYVFELQDDGLPNLNPLPSGVPANFVSDLTSRFRSQNPNHRWEVDHVAHPFSIGEQVSITSSGYVKASIADDKIVGYVTDIGPGPDKFFYKPINKLTKRHFPALPGNIGDYVYIDETTPGALNNVASGSPLFLKLTDSIPAVTIGSNINPVLSPGTVLLVNGESVSFSGVDLTTVVSDIDAGTAIHGVDAEVVFSETSTTGSINGAFTSITPPVTFTINGVLVSLISDNSFAGFSVVSDMVADINGLTGSHGIVASDDSGFLKLTNSSGGAITVVDVDPAAPTAGARKSFIETTGILDAIASTDEIIKLTTADGREILLQDGSIGTATADLGVVSVDNGALPFGMILEQGSKTGEMFVVADIAERNALITSTGDMAFVQDSGENEWAVYIYVNAAWTLLSNEDSSDTDAETISITITGGSVTNNFIHRVSSGSRITMVTVEVITPFDGTAPTLIIGDNDVNDRLMDDFLNDLTVAETFAATPSYQYDNSGLETEIFAYYVPDGSIVGEALVTITYA